MAFPVLQDLDTTLQNTLIAVGVIVIASAIVLAVVATVRRKDGEAANATAVLAANLLMMLGVVSFIAATVVAIHDSSARTNTYKNEMISYVQQEYGIKVPSGWSAIELGNGESVDVTDAGGRPLSVRFTELDTKNPKLWSQDYKQVERLRS